MASIAKFDEWQNSAGLKFGTVVQVVSQDYSNQISTSTTGTFVDANGTVTITPKSASNKILVMCNFSTLVTTSSGVTESHNILLRGSTVLGAPAGWKQSSDYTGCWNNITMTLLDSPATTSAVTYKMQTKRVNGNGIVYIGTGETSNFKWILMEIQA